MGNKTTKYIEIIENIKNKIYCDIYKPNDMLPSEKYLAEEYNVSRKTLRRATNALIEQGFLCSVPGKGIFVDYGNKNLYTVNVEINDFLKKEYDHAHLCSLNIVTPDVYHVYHLNIAPNEKIISMKWMLYREKKIIAYDIKSIPYSQGIRIDESNLGYTTLRDIYRIKYPQNEIIEKGHITINEINPDIKEIMHTNDSIIVTVDKILLDKDMNPLGWNHIYICSDEFGFQGESI
ncbi:MAG: GntR family transcriptional regulator [Eubacteriales bacterium]